MWGVLNTFRVIGEFNSQNFRCVFQKPLIPLSTPLQYTNVMGRKIDTRQDVQVIDANVGVRQKDTIHYVHQMEQVGDVERVSTSDDCVIVTTSDDMVVSNSIYHSGLTVVSKETVDEINSGDSQTVGGAL